MQLIVGIPFLHRVKIVIKNQNQIRYPKKCLNL